MEAAETKQGGKHLKEKEEEGNFSNLLTDLSPSPILFVILFFFSFQIVGRPA